MPLDRFVERNLFERGAGVGVRSDQRVGVGVYEHAHGQCLHTQKDLSSCLVLPVKHMDCTRSAVAAHPGERDMKLGPLLEKLLHQLRNVYPDRARIDVRVVRQILDRKYREEIPESAQRVRVNRHAVQRVVAHLAQAVSDFASTQTEPQLTVSTAGTGQYITEMWATVLFGQLLAECGKTMKDSGYLQIRCLLGTIATRVGKRQIGSIVLALRLQRHHMVDVERGLLHDQVDRSFADEAVSALRAVQLFDQRVGNRLAPSISLG